MGNGGYKIRNSKEIHFVSFAVVDWIDCFNRKEYGELLFQSLEYCQNERGLHIHGYFLMSNHIHLLISSNECQLADILRDFKKFTAKQLLKAIAGNNGESRKEWMLEGFKKAGFKNSRNAFYQFWRQDNQPKECYSNAFTVQKLNYIHNNPVEAGNVEQPSHYLNSSARDDAAGKSIGRLKIDFI